jgi:hypothetical protein
LGVLARLLNDWPMKPAPLIDYDNQRSRISNIPRTGERLNEMEERTIIKKILERIIELNQEDLESLIKEWLGDNEGAQRAFNFDFDNYGNVEAKVVRIITEIERE